MVSRVFPFAPHPYARICSWALQARAADLTDAGWQPLFPPFAPANTDTDDSVVSQVFPAGPAPESVVYIVDVSGTFALRVSAVACPRLIEISVAVVEYRERQFSLKTSCMYHRHIRTHTHTHTFL